MASILIFAFIINCTLVSHNLTYTHIYELSIPFDLPTQDTIHLLQLNTGPFQWILAWRDLIPAQHYASMLEKHFFPKWIQVLSSWLLQNPNFDEVTRWWVHDQLFILVAHLKQWVKEACILSDIIDVLGTSLESYTPPFIVRVYWHAVLH